MEIPRGKCNRVAAIAPAMAHLASRDGSVWGLGQRSGTASGGSSRQTNRLPVPPAANQTWPWEANSEWHRLAGAAIWPTSRRDAGQVTVQPV